jgi:hypothetical protein
MSRRTELLRTDPVATLAFPNTKYVSITHVNLKHFQDSKHTVHDTTKGIVPNCCEYSVRMWRLITDNFSQVYIPTILGLGDTYQMRDKKGNLLDKEYPLWPGANGVSNLIKRHFKILMTNPSTGKNKTIGISIHGGCRHMRAYNLLIQHSYPISYIQKLGGWDKPAMVTDYYASIKARLSELEQIELLERSGLLPSRESVMNPNKGKAVT